MLFQISGNVRALDSIIAPLSQILGCASSSLVHTPIQQRPCLFLYYPVGGYIKSHRDHTASENWVVQINIGCPVVLTVGDNRYPLYDGEIVGFNSKLLHSVCAAPEDRFVISWRKIKPIYLNRQLSLL